MIRKGDVAEWKGQRITLLSEPFGMEDGSLAIEFRDERGREALAFQVREVKPGRFVPMDDSLAEVGWVAAQEVQDIPLPERSAVTDARPSGDDPQLSFGF